MDTQILKPTKLNITRCAKEIASGGAVAFPTETVYGLGALALNPAAVKRVYDIKNRPTDNPLIIHVADKDSIKSVTANIPQNAALLIDAFMPGALTLVLDKNSFVPDIVTAGGDSVAVRMPSHPTALELIRQCKAPIVAPSANTSNMPSPTLAQHVYKDLNDKIPFILDGGQSPIGIESTVADARGEVVKILREGAVAVSDIEKIVKKVEVMREQPTQYGLKYSPCAEVFFSAFYDKMYISICNKYDALINEGRNPVIICSSLNSKSYAKRNIINIGESNEDYAHNLFAALRESDDKGYDCVIAEGVRPDGIGASLISRLIKSSKGQII